MMMGGRGGGGVVRGGRSGHHNCEKGTASIEFLPWPSDWQIRVSLVCHGAAEMLQVSLLPCHQLPTGSPSDQSTDLPTDPPLRE